MLFQGIPFRTLETFSSDEIVSKFITDINVRRVYLENVYRYLVRRKYFKHVRQLLEEKVPPLYDVVISPPNSISDTLLQMIQHPLRLISGTNRITFIENHDNCTTNQQTLISDECVTLILSSFVDEILVPEYTEPIRLFVIPCLANNMEFPFLHLLHYLNDLINRNSTNQSTESAQPTNEYSILSETVESRQNINAINNVFRSSYLFHSLLTLDQLQLERMKSNAIWVRKYINVLGSLSENIRKLQQRSSHSIFKQYDMDIEADDDIDSDEEDDRKIEAIPSTERDCLFEAITLLNDEKRVELILDNIDSYLQDVHVLYSLCKIGHNLMLYHRTAVFEFRYVCVLVCGLNFFRQYNS